jgi:hypothetical protein
MSSKSATKRPTLMQTGRITTTNHSTSLWRLEGRGSRCSWWEEGGSHVKVTTNAKTRRHSKLSILKTTYTSIRNTCRCIIRGESDKYAPIPWKSKLISRVGKSAKCAETLALEWTQLLGLAENSTKFKPAWKQKFCREREGGESAFNKLPGHSTTLGHIWLAGPISPNKQISNNLPK